MEKINFSEALNLVQESVRKIVRKRKFAFDKYDIKEVISITNEKICKYYKSFKPELGTLGGWVYQTAWNACTDYSKKKAASLIREQPLEDWNSDCDEDSNRRLNSKDLSVVRINWTPESDIHSAEEVERIQKSFNILNPRDRKIIDSIVYGLSYKEIAEELGMSIGHVRNRVCIIRERLGKVLSDAA